jgi:aminoglycoside phosphotransferase (APT) family kinase protein
LWVSSVLGTSARIISVQAVRGGTSSAIHALTVEHPSGRRERLILRRYVRTDWLAQEPDLASREAAVLALLEGSEVPSPQLIAFDPTGQDCGVPAVLMTRLTGRIEWAPGDVDQFLRRLAEPLTLIHRVRIPSGASLRSYQPYYAGQVLRAPTWTTNPAAWARAIEAHAGPPPAAPSAFIHRDYHPGNVLWARRRVTGIVDWASASRGAGEADVGHCRVNLVGAFDIEVADRFLRLWQSLSGTRGYHPYWDIAAMTGWLPEMSGRPTEYARLDAFIGRVVAQL